MFDLPLHNSGPAKPAVLEAMRDALAGADTAQATSAGNTRR